jgi:site-specific DNA-methyltransferase (adenine-specific)
MRYTILQEDCIDGMARLGNGCADVVVTSPPYNLGIAYDAYNDATPREEYLRWCRVWLMGIKRVLSKQGSFFLNVAGSSTDPLLPHQLALLAVDCGFVLQNTFQWVKSISVQNKDGTWFQAGHYKPINSKRYVHTACEYVFHLTHTGNVPLDRLALGVPYADKCNTKRWKHAEGHDKRCQGNVWFVYYDTIQSRSTERGKHPATFPVGLAENCLRIHGLGRIKRVLDPFAGTGTVGVAAKKLGIPKFIGFEISKAYADFAQGRLDDTAEEQ